MYDKDSNGYKLAQQRLAYDVMLFNPTFIKPLLKFLRFQCQYII